MDQDLYYKRLMTMLATPVVMCCGFGDTCECQPDSFIIQPKLDIEYLQEDESSGI